jgi:hypothetical protein
MPRSFFPRAVVIEHLHKHEWREDALRRMADLGYVEAGRTRANTLLALPETSQ